MTESIKVGNLSLKAWFTYNDMTYGVIEIMDNKVKVYNVNRGRIEYLDLDTEIVEKP